MTVDMSWTYLDWAQRNLELNGVRIRHARHELDRADVLKWIKEYKGRRFDLIFLRPADVLRAPKRMADDFDVQRDHAGRSWTPSRCSDPDGVLIFSTNLRQFKLDPDRLTVLKIEDITRRTIPRISSATAHPSVFPDNTRRLIYRLRESHRSGGASSSASSRLLSKPGRS